jgi:hypothetical protein
MFKEHVESDSHRQITLVKKQVYLSALIQPKVCVYF